MKLVKLGAAVMIVALVIASALLGWALHERGNTIDELNKTVRKNHDAKSLFCEKAKMLIDQLANDVVAEHWPVSFAIGASDAAAVEPARFCSGNDTLEDFGDAVTSWDLDAVVRGLHRLAAAIPSASVPAQDAAAAASGNGK